MTEPVAIVEFDPTEGGKYCGAKTRPGAKHPQCHQRAGHRTDHVGQGRCRLHGGATPITSGRGSRNTSRYGGVNRPRVKQLIEEMEAVTDPLNTLPELAAARATFVDFLERYDEFTEALLAWHASFTTAGTLNAYAGKPIANVGKPRQVLDVSDAIGHLDTISKMAEREWKRLAENAITRKDLGRLLLQLALAVAQEVREAIADEELATQILKRIRAKWDTLAVAAA
jgi:hypothetical protein